MHEGRGGGTFSSVHSIKMVANPRRDTRRVKRGPAQRSDWSEQHQAGTEVPLHWQGSLHRCSVPGNAPPALLLCLPARNGRGMCRDMLFLALFSGSTCAPRTAELHRRYPRRHPGWAGHRQQGSAQPHPVPHLPELCTESWL